MHDSRALNAIRAKYGAAKKLKLLPCLICVETFHFCLQDRFATSGSVSSVEEDLVIYRLPGDKLGLGLRFDGGAKASEYVHRLFVQGPVS